MSNSTKPKRRRAPNKLKYTPALRSLYDLFMRPFLDRYTLRFDQVEREEGYQAFFSVSTRATIWCAAAESFKMPGAQWTDTSHPLSLIGGTGRRHVKKGEGVVVRLDQQMENRNEVEFDEQVFVLSRAELEYVNSKLVIKA